MSNIFSTLQNTSEHTSEQPVAMPGVASFLGSFVNWALYVLAFAVPLYVCSMFSDAIEFGKQTVFLGIIAITFVAWMGKSLAEKKLTLTRHWMHMVVGLFGLGYLLSALFSQDRALSLFGMPGQVAWSFASILGFILMYVVIVNSVRTTAKVYDMLLVFLGGSFVAAVFGLLQLANVHLLGGVFASRTITTVGSVYSLATYLVVPLLLAAGLVFHGCRNTECLLGSKGTKGMLAQGLVWLTGISSLVFVALVDFWLTWAILLVGSLVMVGASFLRNRKFANPTMLAIPAGLTLVSIVLLAVNMPVSLQLPAEVSPSSSASFAITKQALRDHSIFGTGPGTFIYNYASYRDQLVNASPFWNIRFDRGYSTFHTLLATTGIMGIALWLILIVSLLAKAFTHLKNEKDDDTWYAYLVTFTAFVTFVFTTFFTHLNFTHAFAFWFLMALLTSMVAKNTVTWNKDATMAMSVLSVKFVVILVAAISSIWMIGQRALAESRFTSAVASFRTGASIEEVMAKVESAVKLNPLADAYVRNLGQANLVKAARLIQSKPNAEDAQKVNAAIKASVDLGVEATRVNPRNVDNWSNLALMYQSVASFVRGADEEAIKNYLEASKREPQNPVFLTEIGRLYLLRADAYKTNLNSQDAAKSAEAKEMVPKNLALAEDFLKKAITAKPDYLAARYQLGVVYERQARVKDAIKELATVLANKQNDAGVAFELSILLYRDGQKDQALELLKRVVQVVPENVNARWYLSALQEEKGLYDEAIATLQPVLQKYPDSDAVKQRLNVLTAAKVAKEAPKPQPLPEPINETINNQNSTTPVKP